MTKDATTKAQHISTKTLVLIPCFSAIIAVLSQVAIPTPTGVPVTLQTLAIALAGYVLGRKKGLASVALYLLVGGIGIPVFANMKGGIGSLLGVTGGFLWGFLFLAFFSGFRERFPGFLPSIGFGLLGLVLCHLLGVIQFTLLTDNSLWSSLLLVSIPYLIKDILSVIVAFLITKALAKPLKTVLE